jgi:hypothetical protein
MRQLATCAFLAVLLIDIVGSINPIMCHDGREPPKGVQRMIETLENKRRGPSQCALEQSSRASAIGDRERQNQEK